MRTILYRVHYPLEESIVDGLRSEKLYMATSTSAPHSTARRASRRTHHVAILPDLPQLQRVLQRVMPFFPHGFTRGVQCVSAVQLVRRVVDGEREHLSVPRPNAIEDRAAKTTTVVRPLSSILRRAIKHA